MPDVSITNLSTTGITNGLANNAIPVSNGFTTANSNFSSLAAKVNGVNVNGNLEDALTLTLRSAFTGTPSSGNNISIIAKRGVSANTGVRWNESLDCWQLTNDGTNWYAIQAGASAIALDNSTRPQWGSDTTLTVTRISTITDNGESPIFKSTSTTLNIATTGINGIAQSANLTGTVTVTSGANTVAGSGTAFTTDYVVGDVFTTAGGQSRRITVIGSNTSITVESNWSSTETGVTYRRGGRAPSTWYNLYYITDGTTPGLIASTRSVAGAQTLVDLPTGYTQAQSKQARFAFRLNSSSNILRFFILTWPDYPMVMYNLNFINVSGSAGATTLLNGGVATSFTDISAAGLIPPISTIGIFKLGAVYNSAGTVSSFRTKGVSHNGVQVQSNSVSNTTDGMYYLETDSSQVIQYQVDNAGTAATISCMGYIANGVP